MTLYALIESALTCHQQRADGSLVPLLAKSRRGPMRSAIKRYAAMLGLDPAMADATDAHRPDHEIRALIEAKAPTTFAATTVRNLLNDVLWLLRTAVDQGWLDPLPAALMSWRQRRPSPGKTVPRHEIPTVKRYRLPLAECPTAFRDDLAAYLRWCEAPFARNRDRHVAKRPVTSRSTSATILQLAGFATHIRHEPIDTLTLRRLCQPDFLEAFANWWLTERRGKMTRGLSTHLITASTVARHWLKDRELSDRLNDMLRSLPPVEVVRDKRSRWLTLAQLEDVGLSLHPFNAQRVHDFPHITQPYARTRSQRRWAYYVMWSLIIRLLIRLPMRQRCIREMQLEQNLYQDHSGVWRIRFVGTELKVAALRGQTNRYEFPFPIDLVPLLEEWLKDWRPKVSPPAATHVFMNSAGRPLNTTTEMAEMLSRTTYRFTGVGVTPHLIRDIWATEYLEANPGDVSGAARRLGNTEQMIWLHYAHILKQNVDARADAFLQGTFAKGKSR